MADPLGAVFHALSDPTRREILDRLRGGEVSVSSLARPFDMSLPAVSKHLAVLESAALVRREKRGRVNYCHLEPGGLDEAQRWVETQRRFWEDRLDSLGKYLESSNQAGGAGKGARRPAPAGGSPHRSPSHRKEDDR